MDIAVHTGVTKSVSGTSLVSLSFTSKEGEHVILVLQVQSTPRDAKTIEEECSIVIKHSLLETEGDSWTRLDGSLKELNGLLKGLLVSEAVEDVHAVVALVDPSGSLHVSSAGRGEAYLVRGGSASQITEFSKGKPVSAFIHIASGPLENADAVVFSTQRLLRSLTPAQLVNIMQGGGNTVGDIVQKLDDDRENAALAVLQIGSAPKLSEPPARAQSSSLPSRRSGQRRMQAGSSLLRSVKSFGARLLPTVVSWSSKGLEKVRHSTPSSKLIDSTRKKMGTFLKDLRHPERKRRAHFLILAAAVSAFLVIFLIVKLTTTTQRSKTRTELGALVETINTDIRTADNRRLAGDTQAANDILERANERAKQILDNESGYFRVEANDLLDRIRSKREEINNILRVSPRIVVNLSSKNPSVAAQGLLGIADGEFISFDRQNWYHVLLNTVDDPKRLTDDGFIIDGSPFSRYKSVVFMTTGNSVVELQGNQPVTMKTDDPSGWMTGKDLETYLRYLYILTTDNKVEKYERLTNRYGAGVQYNINGDLTGSLDMAIDSSVYILKEGGSIVKLFRGEAKPFSIAHAPSDALKNATKMFKVTDRDFFFLDPTDNRIIVVSDGGESGEATYLKQYLLEGDQLGKLQDFYVDPDESHIYVTDEKRIWVVDLVK